MSRQLFGASYSRRSPMGPTFWVTRIVKCVSLGAFGSRFQIRSRT